jgi:hypothetical protein
MKDDLTKTNTSEEAELARKKVEIERLSQVLAEKERGIEELKLTVLRFQHRYYSKVGRKYVELDELRAQIAELKARKRLHDHELKQEAQRARTQARNSEEDYEEVDIEPQLYSPRSEQLEDAKKLYRQVACIIHPDKATDDKSRHLRTKLMAELNEAYAKRDVNKMSQILDRWQRSSETISGESTTAELIKIIRALSQIKRRISEIEAEIFEIITSDINVLMVKVHNADLAGRDILAEMALSIDYEIQDARNVLAMLKNLKYF